MLVGDELVLRLAFTPEDATDKSFNIGGYDKSVVSVSEDGVVTAKAEGTTTITFTATNGTETTSDDVTATCVVTVVKPAPSYAATSGAGSTWTKGSKDSLALTFKRTVEGETADTTFAHFKSAAVDGKELTKGTDYSAAEGSVVVTLKPAYLESLPVGKHALTATFDDGSATVEFAVADAAKPEPTPTPAAAYTIAFDANGGSGSMDRMSVEAGKSVALAANAFKRSNYTFSGWNTAKDGSGTAYADRATVTPAADMVLYAQWKQGSSPSSASKSSLPKTGDTAPAAAAALALAGAGAAATGLLRRRRQR